LKQGQCNVSVREGQMLSSMTALNGNNQLWNMNRLIQINLKKPVI